MKEVFQKIQAAAVHRVRNPLGLSVAGILKSIEKNISDLEEVAKAKTAEAGDAHDKALVLVMEGMQAEQEASRAVRVAKRLKELVA